MTTSTNPVGTALAKQACADWPDLPSRTLGRKLMTDNPGVWSTLAAARATVLWHRGKRKSTGGHKSPNPFVSTAPSVPWNPEAYLPKSDERAFLPHVVEVASDCEALILGDIHVPYHNLPALTAALEHGRKRNCKIVVLNGDTLDFHRLSRFQKDPRARNAKGEIDRANQLLDAVDELFPKARRIWKDGNHDERFDNYLAAHAEELFDVVKDAAALPKLLELQDRGWEYVSEKRPIYLGALTLLHGHEMPAGMIGPVNAARGLFLRAKACAMVNHHHQTSEHTEPDIRGKIITTWSNGCLCELHPLYARFNKWNHGSSTVELAASGDFKVHGFRISDGKLLN